MNWKIIIVLSLFGIAMGIVSLFGYTQGIELFLWIAIAIFSVVVLAKTVNHKLLLRCLTTGLLSGFFNGIIQSSFFSMYLANNSQISDARSVQNKISSTWYIGSMKPPTYSRTGESHDVQRYKYFCSNGSPV